MHPAVGTFGWVGLGLLTFGPGTALVYLLATNLGLAFGDVIVVRCDRHHLGFLQCSIADVRLMCARGASTATAAL